jgi:hypothetical protein
MSKAKSLPLRQQLLIDKDVQGAVLQRTILYSVCCVVYFLVIMFFSTTAETPEDKWHEIVMKCLDEAVYWAPGLMLLTPVIAYDLLTLTNRFAGPVFRLRREMQRLTSGEESYPLSFRDGDYWMEMADLFNQVRDEMLELREFKARGPGTARYDMPRVEKLFVAEDDDEQTEDEDLLVSSNS